LWCGDFRGRGCGPNGSYCWWHGHIYIGGICDIGTFWFDTQRANNGWSASIGIDDGDRDIRNDIGNNWFSIEWNRFNGAHGIIAPFVHW
jgi:hypothetical protein